MRCPSCQANIPADSRFCPVCGGAVPAPHPETVMRTDPQPAYETLHRHEAPEEVPDWPTDSSPSMYPAVSRATYLWAALGIIGGLIGWFTVKDRDPRLGRNVLIAGAGVSLAVLLLVVVGNLALLGLFTGSTTDSSQSGTTSQGTDGSGDTSTATGTEVTGVDIVSQDTVTEFAWTYVDDVDATTRVTGMVDEPVQSSDDPYVEMSDGARYVPGDACGGVDDSVGIVPIDVSLENTSSDTVAAEMAFSLDVQYERYYTGGAECYEANETSSGSWDDLAAGDSGSAVAVALIPDYWDTSTSMSDFRLTPLSTDVWGVNDLTGRSLDSNGSSFLLRESSETTTDSSDVTPQDASGTYTGTMSAYKSDTIYDLELILEQDGQDISATVTATSRDTGNRGSYSSSGYIEGDRIVINGDEWLDRPNASWYMDHLDLTVDQDSVSGTFAALDKPAKPVGSVYASR